jgi:hypothetical protein
VTVTTSLGGLFIGLVLLLRQFLPAVWAAAMKKIGRPGGDHDHHHGTGKFNIRDHAPFVLGTILGMLAIACPGGVLGTIAGHIVGFSNAIGDKVLAAGSGGATTSVTRHAAATLTQYGGMVTALLVGAVLILRKILDKRAKNQMASGVWCGCTLGLSAGAAGLTAAVLIPAANQLGVLLGGQA